MGAMIEGLQLAYADDDALLAQGMTLFDSLYRSFEQSVRSAGPRPLARPQKTSAARDDKHDGRRRRGKAVARWQGTLQRLATRPTPTRSPARNVSAQRLREPH